MNASFENALQLVVGLNQPQLQCLTEQNIIDENVLALLDEAAIVDLFSVLLLTLASSSKCD